MRRRHLTETLLVLGVSLGSSAVYALLRIVDRLTRPEALSQQTSAMNSSVTPDRPWLDVTYQLAGIAFALVPVLLAFHLLRRDDPAEPRTMGFDLRRPVGDLWRGAALAAVIGIPGLGLYLVAKAVGLNTTVAAANLVGAAWFTVPILVLAAAQNAVLEETIMIGYLFRRWTEAGWGTWRVIVTSAVIRGTYHLYQGFGGFVGNIVMGLLFGWLYTRTKRVMPLVVAHTILDVVAFVGYSLLKPHVSWL
ncbi:CPBP family intramembrane glutamic endopeptidase [Phycicoccus flavus]|uniref:CPBP family intramembrane glutamic endopeptidase n=1 Tax=Phycicoccus flavus TaxID=2502783 RepID=UPI000FEBC37A|nr:CPBP family intramembrane glutamic endopeptidase [Phycicoccus flavus]NHA67603.1 CPBP family intramembrane metalloprotease [Phycicoccus flavus]